MFEPKTAEEIESAAEGLGIEPAALLAIAEVESGGQVFAVVDGRDEPLIRFEGHYFDKRLSDADRARARADGIASPVAGEVANPASQEARWRLLRARRRDRPAGGLRVGVVGARPGDGRALGSGWALPTSTRWSPRRARVRPARRG